MEEKGVVVRNSSLKDLRSLLRGSGNEDGEYGELVEGGSSSALMSFSTGFPKKQQQQHEEREKKQYDRAMLQRERKMAQRLKSCFFCLSTGASLHKHLVISVGNSSHHSSLIIFSH